MKDKKRVSQLLGCFVVVDENGIPLQVIHYPIGSNKKFVYDIFKETFGKMDKKVCSYNQFCQKFSEIDKFDLPFYSNEIKFKCVFWPRYFETKYDVLKSLFDGLFDTFYHMGYSKGMEDSRQIFSENG